MNVKIFDCGLILYIINHRFIIGFWKGNQNEEERNKKVEKDITEMKQRRIKGIKKDRKRETAEGIIKVERHN